MGSGLWYDINLFYQLNRNSKIIGVCSYAISIELIAVVILFLFEDKKYNHDETCLFISQIVVLIN
jgi:hypothetical protein